jgi:hypothetical protein
MRNTIILRLFTGKKMVNFSPADANYGMLWKIDFFGDFLTGKERERGDDGYE